jgi:hypothetical protein
VVSRFSGNKLDTSGLFRSRVADLPSQGVLSGAIAYATDGMKRVDAAGGGTGCLVYSNVLSDGTVEWRRFYDDLAVTDDTAVRPDLIVNDLTVDGDLIVAGTAAFAQAVTMASTLAVTGTLSALGDFINTVHCAEIYGDENNPEVTSITQDVVTHLEHTYLVQTLNGFTHSDGTLTYTETRTRLFVSMVTVSGTKGAGASSLFETRIRRASTELAASGISRQIASGTDEGAWATQSIFTLDTGDTIDVSVENVSSNDDITAQHVNLSLFALPTEIPEGTTIP